MLILFRECEKAKVVGVADGFGVAEDADGLDREVDDLKAALCEAKMSVVTLAAECDELKCKSGRKTTAAPPPSNSAATSRVRASQTLATPSRWPVWKPKCSGYVQHGPFLERIRREGSARPRDLVQR